jgi:hypothetical protein
MQGEKGSRSVQQLTLQAKSPESALALAKALSQFEPTSTTDEEGRSLISIEIGNDRHAVEVLDVIRSHFAGRGGEDSATVMSVSGNIREFSTRVR